MTTPTAEELKKAQDTIRAAEEHARADHERRASAFLQQVELLEKKFGVNIQAVTRPMDGPDGVSTIVTPSLIVVPAPPSMNGANGTGNTPPADDPPPPGKKNGGGRKGGGRKKKKTKKK